MPVLYHGCREPLDTIPAGTQLTDSRQYSEYAGWALARSTGQAHYYAHEVVADHHEVTYVSHEPLANANIYRLKVDVPVTERLQRSV